jgi:hypothetical protein
MVAVPMLVAGSIALSGCGGRGAGNPTTISYREVGVCKSYDTPTGTTTAKTNEAFAVFKIVAVDNTKQNSAFNFDPQRIYVDQSTAEQKTKSQSFQSRRFGNPDPRFAQAVGVKGIQMVNINAGEKLTTNGFVIVPLSAPADSSETAQDSFDLVYDTSTTEQQWALGGVVLTKTNPAGTKFTLVESCKELAFE